MKREISAFTFQTKDSLRRTLKLHCINYLLDIDHFKFSQSIFHLLQLFLGWSHTLYFKLQVTSYWWTPWIQEYLTRSIVYQCINQVGALSVCLLDPVEGAITLTVDPVHTISKCMHNHS